MSLSEILNPSTIDQPWKALKVYSLDAQTSITASNIGETLVLNVMASGIWGSPLPVKLYFTKTGKSVLMGYTAVVSTESIASAISISGITLPSDFYPSVNYNGLDSSGDIYYNIPIIDNSVESVGTLQFSIEVPPSLSIFISTSSQGNFAGSGVGGFFCGSISYATD